MEPPNVCYCRVHGHIPRAYMLPPHQYPHQPSPQTHHQTHHPSPQTHHPSAQTHHPSAQTHHPSPHAHHRHVHQQIVSGTSSMPRRRHPQSGHSSSHHQQHHQHHHQRRQQQQQQQQQHDRYKHHKSAPSSPVQSRRENSPFHPPFAENFHGGHHRQLVETPEPRNLSLASCCGHRGGPQTQPRPHRHRRHDSTTSGTSGTSATSGTSGTTDTSSECDTSSQQRLTVGSGVPSMSAADCVKNFCQWMSGVGDKVGKGTTAFLDALPSIKGDHHVVMVGLDSAGKTTVLYRLKFDQYVNTVPTIGFNCEKVKGTVGRSRGLTFLLWDVGGQEKIRPLWRPYTRATDGIVFVLDSCDKERFEEARLELHRIMRTPDNTGVPLLVIANKQDLPKAKSAGELERLLGLSELGVGQLWHLEPCCAVTGEGLDTAVDALHELIVKRKKLAKRARNKTR